MRFERLTRQLLVGLVLAGLVVPSMASDTESDRMVADPPGAIPYDLAFQTRALRRNDPPVVSPDGSHVAYVVVVPSDVRGDAGARFLANGTPVDAIGARIHLSLAGSRPQAESSPICGGGGNQWNPAWSPDGRLLGFYSDEGGRAELWIHEVEAGGCRRVSEAFVRASMFGGFQPRWSPDGRVVYVPLRPDPPLEMSDASVPLAFETAAGDGEGSSAPLVFHSGSEAATPQRRAAPFDFTGYVLAYNNATLGAVDAETGEVRTLVDARVEPRPSTLKVSPSGRWISYASVPEGNPAAPLRDVVLVPATGGDPVVLVSGLAPSADNSTEPDYRWHPREDRLVYLHEGTVWQVDVGENGAGEPRQLSEALGEPVAPILYFTRDGRSLLVGLDPQGRGRERAPAALAVVPLDGGAPVRVPLPDSSQWQFLGVVRANEDVLWQPDPRHLTVQVRNRSTGHEALYRIALASGQARQIDSGLHRLRHFSSGNDHRHLYAVYEDIATPPDLYRYDSANLSRRSRVSRIEPRLEGIAPASAQVIENVVPLHDGRLQTVRTTLLLPHGAKAGDRLPAIVMIYSGSDLSMSAAQYGGGMGNTVPNQIFTSRGFAVVMADVRLSEMGEPGHPAQDMTDTLLPQVYALANAGYIDIGRLAVSGQSFGGYSTAAIVSTTNLFRAGIPVNGPFDLAALYGEMDSQGNSFTIHWAENGQGRMGQSPWDNIQRYIVNSPYYRIDRIHTPLLIVAGEKDNAVPFEESKRLFVGLRRLDKPAQLAIYPGEGHVVNEWSAEHAADVSRRMIEFLRRHLAPR